MASFMKEFEHLKIHLEDLKRATNSFGSKVIGAGGFGKVYEGEISPSKGRSKVAIKRLSREFGQGDPEFLKEIMMLSRHSHKNLITLLGYCDEDGEKILVYEHASNGSLDRHLSSNVLTWAQRLKICLDAAKGLKYLHDHRGTHQRILHRDIKSANILLDDNWNAKLSDMGLSKFGPANQHSVLVTNVVGTPGYCDPQYMETYTLSKESDIYSFGVVLFEVLCGGLCFKTTTGQLEILVPMWKQNYIHKKLDHIIFKDLKPPMDPTSLETFSEIAFQCLHYSREQRPTTSLLVRKLEIAFKCQERHDVMKLTNVVGKYEKYNYFDKLLSKGKEVFFNIGKKKKEGAKRKDAKGSAATVGKGAATKRELVHFDGTMIFTLEDLLRGSAEVMGKSTYGTYYKATLENGDCFTVVRLGLYLVKNQRKVEAELNLLGKISHRNLLTMRAYSLHPEETLLVYDYMPKGSLAVFLHARTYQPQIDWATRMRIAKGVARGLHSLHTHHNIIHGNLTSSNLFLDESINPKISDIGMSRLVTASANSDMIATARILGYQAPELSKLEKADMKTDVYSLGVIMLELLTGKSPGEMEDQNLPQWVGSIIESEWISEVLDLDMLRDTPLDEDEMVSTLQLAMECVSKLPHRRPDVQQVLQQLEEIRPETATTSSDDGGAGPLLS
ncbi:putative protein kinase RLK-Pelle-LRR-III family [Helianthus annuus]|nr:putative protein kinase RLK-Pelle-LRR-III family [Helianthus annuus]